MTQQRLRVLPPASATRHPLTGWFHADGFGASESASAAVNTAAIQAAINAASAAASSGDSGAAGKGTVYLPGRYPVGNLVLRSNVRIKGQGFRSSALLATASSGFVLGTSGLSVGIRMANVVIEDITIGPTARVTGLGTRPGCGGIDFSHSQWCELRSVFIHNVAGTGVDLTEAFDLVTHGVHLLYVGTDATSPALLMGGTADDTCNATHHFGMRIERCPVMIRTTGTRPPFNNQFIGCKFEWHNVTGMPTLSEPGMQLESALQLTFSDSHFVTDVNDQPIIRAGHTTGTVVGLKFSACDWISGNAYNGWAFDGLANCADPQFVGGHATQMAKGFTTAAGSIPTFIGFNSYNCLAPIIDGIGVQIHGGRHLQMVSAAANTAALRVSSRGVVFGAHIQGQDAPAAGYFRPDGVSAGNDTQIIANLFERIGAGIFFSQAGGVERDNRFTTVTLRVNGAAGYLDSNETDQRLVVPATALILANGVPAPQHVFRTPAWLLDAATAEAVTWSREDLPSRWLSYDVEIVWANVGAGSGAVTWRADIGNWATGDTMTTPASGATVVSTAGAAGVVMRTTLATDVPRTAGKWPVIVVHRLGADAGDTLSNDAGLLALVLTRKS